MKFKTFLPAIFVAVTVFVAVACSFIYYGIVNVDNETNKINSVEDYRCKNIFIGVQNSDNNSLEVSAVAMFNPNNNTIKTVFIPADTKVNIATSEQMFKEVINVGGPEIIREVMAQIVPLEIDYHLIIKSNDLYNGGAGYENVIKSVLSNDLWNQENLSEYLHQILSLSNTDLTLIKNDEYAQFIDKFAQRTNHFYNLPGIHSDITGRSFYVVDVNAVNELVNTEFFG